VTLVVLSSFLASVQFHWFMLERLETKLVRIGEDCGGVSRENGEDFYGKSLKELQRFSQKARRDKEEWRMSQIQQIIWKHSTRIFCCFLQKLMKFLKQYDLHCFPRSNKNSISISQQTIWILQVTPQDPTASYEGKFHKCKISMRS
jgi:hypothetical protein